MTTARQIPTAFDDSAAGWERALYAFLAEKKRRSGSRRTVESYSRMLQDFFGRAGKPPVEVQPPEVLAWAHGVGASGRGALRRHDRRAPRLPLVLLPLPHPHGRGASEPLRRARTPQDQSQPATGPQCRRGATPAGGDPGVEGGPAGPRDHLTLVLTGRRRSEVLNLTAGDIEPGEPPFYTYRGKGGKRGRRELPRPAYEATPRALSAFGRDLAGMAPTHSLWPPLGEHGADGRGVTSGTFYGNFRRYLD